MNTPTISQQIAARLCGFDWKYISVLIDNIRAQETVIKILEQRITSLDLENKALSAEHLATSKHRTALLEQNAVFARTIQALRSAIEAPADNSTDWTQDSCQRAVDLAQLALVEKQNEIDAKNSEFEEQRKYLAVIERDEFGRLLFFKDPRPDTNGVQAQ